jgi:hypothetical protein
MPEIGTSGSMSGDGKRAIGKASSTVPILDSTRARRTLATEEMGHERTIGAGTKAGQIAEADPADLKASVEPALSSTMAVFSEP